MKKAIEGFRAIKTSTIANSKILQGLLNKYEELNLKQYNESNDEGYVFNNPAANPAIKDQMDVMIDNQKNPFEDMYHWCKGEIYDVQAV